VCHPGRLDAAVYTEGANEVFRMNSHSSRLVRTPATGARPGRRKRLISLIRAV